MIKHYAGLLLIVLGALALIMTRLEALDSSNTLQALDSSNTLLATGLLFIVAGIGLHIRSIKRESRY